MTRSLEPDEVDKGITFREDLRARGAVVDPTVTKPGTAGERCRVR
jgi:hypothetical protein